MDKWIRICDLKVVGVRKCGATAFKFHSFYHVSWIIVTWDMLKPIWLVSQPLLNLKFSSWKCEFCIMLVKQCCWFLSWKKCHMHSLFTSHYSDTLVFSFEMKMDLSVVCVYINTVVSEISTVGIIDSDKLDFPSSHLCSLKLDWWKEQVWGGWDISVKHRCFPSSVRIPHFGEFFNEQEFSVCRIVLLWNVLYLSILPQIFL